MVNDPRLDELKTLLREAGDLQHAAAVLFWDQQTYMPPGAAESRGRQMALLEGLAHRRATDARIGHLLDDLRALETDLPYDSDDAALLRVARRAYLRLVNVPPAFVEAASQHAVLSYQAWTEARPANDFAAMCPLLEKTLDFSRRYADFFPGYQHVADPLIDDSDYGMSAERVRTLFAELRAPLVELVRAITALPAPDASCLHRHYPQAQQLAFGEQVIRAFGYDFTRGRQDLTHHPFMTTLGGGDVRITTHVKEHDLTDALFSTLHESGHAMYEQGIAPAFEALPLGTGTSAGVHESQSRLWENLVGRSLPFWEHYYPLLQAAFPGTLDDVPLAAFYRAINRVQRSLIRIDADEVTYNLHVMIRFDLELALLEGALEVRHLPDAWHARYESDLGVRAPDDRDGVLQDVHWYGGRIGGVFQGYTLGNVMSGLFFDAALNAHPDIPDAMRRGDFTALHGWLRDNVYRHGSKFTAHELVERVTGAPLSIAPYLGYLRSKYGALYGV